MGFETRTRTASTSGAVTVGAASVAALASNPDRKVATFVNDSTNIIYLQLGATAVSGEGIRLNASGGAYVIDNNNLFTGAVNAIATGAGSNLVVTESP